MVSFQSETAVSYTLSNVPYSSSGIRGHEFCKRCNVGGCDLKVLDCGCFLHARCTPVAENSPLTICPVCRTQIRALYLIPMNFDEIDEAKAAAANMAPSVKRGKKRKNATIARLNPSTSNVDDTSEGADLRTGRWTTEETLYCDKLIEKFEQGQLPIVDGIKLNDFLSNMLKSKQSRLTKKMKNARLSAKAYKRQLGYISEPEEARHFSELETSFFGSIQCDMERAEIRFHMQKEWRELFSSYCVAMGQKLDADSWLSSVEEMDRRASQAKDAARMARRKVMMGYALSQDSMNPEQGVFIERSTSSESRSGLLSTHNSSSSLTGLVNGRDKRQRMAGARKSLREYSSPFVGKVIQYIHRHNIPFEHIDAWVPSFVPGSTGAGSGPNASSSNGRGGSDQKCRLCFAGFATTDTQIPIEGGRPVPLNSQDQFDLLSFGEYSQKFSFDVGCGLPGRVYSSGICSWEQGVENAPSGQFERCGGASQWGIKTVLGIPVPSPNVGRIVMLLYSRHDRRRDPEMVRRITEEFTKLMPTPKWKLVVDVGPAPPRSDPSKPVDRRVYELIKLLAEHTPTSKNSPYAPYLPGFTSLRLMLMKQTKTQNETDLVSTMLESYSSYISSNRSAGDIAWMIARDFMLLSQPSQRPQVQQQPQQQQQQQQQHTVIYQQQQPVGIQQHQPQQQHQVMPQQVGMLSQQHSVVQQTQSASMQQPQHAIQPQQQAGVVQQQQMQQQTSIMQQQQQGNVIQQHQTQPQQHGMMQLTTIMQQPQQAPQQQQPQTLQQPSAASVQEARTSHVNASSTNGSLNQNNLQSRISHLSPSSQGIPLQPRSAFQPMSQQPATTVEHSNGHISL